MAAATSNTAKPSISKTNTSKATKKKGLRGKLFGLFWLALTVVFISAHIKNNMTLGEIENTKAGIQLEIDGYNEKIAELERSRNYFDSDAYVEKIAREQLGLVKPDEVLYYNESK